MDSEHGRPLKHGQETREALIRSARKLFGERGYHDVGIRELAEEARVTRGALYHHFGDKASIFEAVFDDVQADLVNNAAQRHLKPGRPNRWTQLKLDLQVSLDDALRPDIRQIRLIDAPLVFGWQRWLERAARPSLDAICKAVSESIRLGLIRPCPVYPMTLLIRGAVREASLEIAHSKTAEETRVEMGKALDILLDGLELPQANTALPALAAIKSTLNT